MNSDIYDKIAEFCDENKLFQWGDGVVAGVSGGADSVFLLYVLAKLRKRWNLRLLAVHINHGIRGEEALRDQEYAVSFAERLGISGRVERADIPSLAGQWHMTEEEAGRTYRYQCFERLREELGYQKVAVAHHRDDQAETILFQLLRGSSLRGLGGMRPKRQNVVRPLLEVGRGEIEEALRREGISYCTDSTNLQDGHARNLLRNHVMPYLQENIQPAAAEHIASAGKHLVEIMDYIDHQKDVLFQNVVRQRGKVLVIRETAFLEIPLVLQREIILEMVRKIVGKCKDITSAHVELVLSVFLGKTGRVVMIPYGLRAEKSYEDLLMYRDGENVQEDDFRPEIIQTGRDYQIPLGKGKQCRVVFERKILENFSECNKKKHCTKCFDYDRMDSMPGFRYPEAGDFLWLDADGKKKKLSRLFIDEKIALKERERIVVLAEGHHILWIPALGRCSAYYYVSGSTREVVQACIFSVPEPREKGGHHEGSST